MYGKNLNAPNSADRQLELLTESYAKGRMTKFEDKRLSDKRLEPGHIRSGNGDALGTVTQPQLIAIGVAACRCDVIHINHKRAMALEDIIIVLEFFCHGSQRRVNLHIGGFGVFQITDRNVILLRLDVEQAIDGNREVVTTDIGIMDGYQDILLLFSRVVQ